MSNKTQVMSLSVGRACCGSIIFLELSVLGLVQPGLSPGIDCCEGWAWIE